MFLNKKTNLSSDYDFSIDSSKVQERKRPKLLIKDNDDTEDEDVDKIVFVKRAKRKPPVSELDTFIKTSTQQFKASAVKFLIFFIILKVKY